MTCSNTALAASNGTDALFRLWGKAISDAIAAAGWTKSSDTGQISWTSVTAPTSTSTAAGFEMWQTADALTTWYMKIEYGSGPQTAYPAIWVTVGTATSGTGTLSGQVSTRFTLCSSSSTTSLYSCAFAGGNNWLAFSMFYDCNSNQTFTLIIERLKTTAGADADTGMVIIGSCSASRYHQVVPLTGTVWALNSGTTVPYWPMMAPPSGLGTSLNGTTVGIATLHPWAQVHYSAMLGALSYFSNTPDISAYATFQASRYGTNRTYLALGTNTPSHTSMALAMRYE